jgi:hypothetical protein
MRLTGVIGLGVGQLGNDMAPAQPQQARSWLAVAGAAGATGSSSSWNWRVRASNSLAIRDRSAADRWVSSAPPRVSSAASATPVMLDAIAPEPAAASPTLRAISLVVAACCSTAEAIID